MKVGKCSPLIAFLLPLVAWAPVASAGSKDILSGSVAVPAARWEKYAVTVTDGMLRPRITGLVTASGGTGNDIIVAVMPGVDFINWANGHRGGAYYNSGQVTMADVKANLPPGPGVYVVLLDNGFSAFTPKTVEGRIQLVWDDPPPVLQGSMGAPAGTGTGRGPGVPFHLVLLAIALLSAVIGGAAMALVLARGKAKSNS